MAKKLFCPGDFVGPETCIKERLAYDKARELLQSKLLARDGGEEGGLMAKRAISVESSL